MGDRALERILRNVLTICNMEVRKMTLKEFRGDLLDIDTLACLLEVSRMTIFRYRKLKILFRVIRRGVRFSFSETKWRSG